MDFAIVFEKVIELFLKICSVSVVMFGVEFKVGALFVFCGLASVLICFLKGMVD